LDGATTDIQPYYQDVCLSKLNAFQTINRFGRAQVDNTIPAQGAHTPHAIHGSAISRAEMFRVRHELSWQRIVRNPSFIQSHRNSATTLEGQSKLSRLDSLQGMEVGARCCVLGSLVQIEEGSLSLEDPYDVVNSLSFTVV
jgi:hypothetical protein